MTKHYLAPLLLLGITACGDTSENSDPPTSEAADDLGSLNGPPPPPEGAAAVPELPATDEKPAEIDGITNKRITFDQGMSSKRIEGTITGDETIDYLLNVNAGQSMNISMSSSNTAAYFNVLAPGETAAAIFNGSIGENMFEGVAEESGDYRIRVYLYRSAARRNEKADYGLEVAIN